MEIDTPVNDLTCSICMNIYTDPISLQCGHSFCRLCMDHVLDHHLVFGEYYCPQCKTKLKKRPLLPNTEIRHAMQIYRAAQEGEQTEEQVKVSCLYCVESPVPAVKTCVQYETSLCDHHLEAHNQKLNHILIPPTASLAHRRCSEHNHPLVYYCLQHAACVCESCCMRGNHRGHGVMSVNEAFNIEKKELNNFLDKLKLREENIDRRLKSVTEVTSKARQKTEALRTEINDSVREVRKQVSLLQNQMKRSLFTKLQKISRPELTRRLHKQKETLSSKVRHVGELCDMTDDVALLQKVELDKNLHDDPDEDTEHNDELIPSIDLSEDVTAASLLSRVSALLDEALKHYSSNVSLDESIDIDNADISRA